MSPISRRLNERQERHRRIRSTTGPSSKDDKKNGSEKHSAGMPANSGFENKYDNNGGDNGGQKV